MIIWKRWMFRHGDLQMYVFRPTWQTVTIGIGYSFEPHPHEATFMLAIGPFHGGVWWRRPRNENYAERREQEKQ